MDELLVRFNVTKPLRDHGTGLRARLRKPWLFFVMARREVRSKVRLSPRHSLRAWRHGFTRWSYFLYELDRRDPRDYLNDWVQFLAPGRINGLHRPAAAEKLFFSRTVEALGAPCPRIRGVIVRGRLFGVEGGEPAGPVDWRALLEAHPPGIVLKPLIGCEGSGLAFLRRGAAGFELNGRPASAAEVDAVVARLDDYLLTDFVVQHPYAARIYPRTTNTLRLVTLWDPDTQAPFLAACVQRIGSERSYPVDNFKMGAGGLSAAVDLATGELGPGVYRPDTGGMQRHANHPDTGSPIEGVRVPGWTETVRQILGFAARLPHVPFLGWDIVMTEDGYRVIETNPGSGFFLIQVHGPLRADPRVRRFFAAHGFG